MVTFSEFDRLSKRVLSKEDGTQAALDSFLAQVVGHFVEGHREAAEIITKYIDSKIKLVVDKNPIIRQSDKEDLIQEIHATIITNLLEKKFDMQKGKLGGYAYIIARNKIKDYREKKREIQTDIEPMIGKSGDKTNPDSELGKQERELLITLMQKLDDKYKTVLKMHFLQGYKIHEISNELKIPTQDVSNLKNYGIKKLREAFLQANLKKDDFF